MDLQPRRLTPEAQLAFFHRLVEQARALPGVRAATVAELVPLGGSNMETILSIAGAPARDAPNGRRRAHFNVVGPGSFETLGLPVVRGRGIAPTDREGAPGVVVVNETMARRLWPNGHALGQRLSIEGPDGPWMTVAGVARDAKYNSIGEDVPAFMYLSHEQHVRAQLVLHVRAADPAAAALHRSLRTLVAQLDPMLPPPPVATVDEDMRISTLPAQIGAEVTAVMGGLALLLSTVGIYGVVAFAVARCTGEIGVRAELGAAPADLVRGMMGEAGRSVAVGLAIGLALALGAGRVLGSVLYEIGVVDPVMLVLTPLPLGGAALAAAYLPARRATRVSPTVALRAE